MQTRRTNTHSASSQVTWGGIEWTKAVTLSGGLKCGDAPYYGGFINLIQPSAGTPIWLAVIEGVSVSHTQTHMHTLTVLHTHRVSVSQINTVNGGRVGGMSETDRQSRRSRQANDKIALGVTQTHWLDRLPERKLLRWCGPCDFWSTLISCWMGLNTVWQNLICEQWLHKWFCNKCFCLYVCRSQFCLMNYKLTHTHIQNHILLPEKHYLICNYFNVFNVWTDPTINHAEKHIETRVQEVSVPTQGVRKSANWKVTPENMWLIVFKLIFSNLG